MHYETCLLAILHCMRICTKVSNYFTLATLKILKTARTLRHNNGGFIWNDGTRIYVYYTKLLSYTQFFKFFSLNKYPNYIIMAMIFVAIRSIHLIHKIDLI